MKWRWWVALITSAASDTVVEVLGGFVPLVGDLVDLGQIALNVALLGPAPELLLGIPEFVPFADFLPFHSASVILYRLRRREIGQA